MADGILGLFGTQNPQQLQQDYLANLSVSPAQMGQQGLLQQLISTGANAGTMMGYGAGRLLGGKVAGEVEASQIEDVLQQVNKMNLPSNYEKFTALSGLLAEKGLTKQSMVAAAEAEKLKPKAAETTKLAKLINEQSKFTEGSPQWKAYQGAIDKETKPAADKKSPFEVKMDLAGVTDPAQRQALAKQALDLELKANQGDPTAMAALNLMNKQLDIKAKQQELAAAEAAKTEQAKAKVQSASAEAYKTNNILNTIKTAKSQVGGSTAGLGGAIMKNLAGSEAVDLEENLLTIKANIGFNELTQMRKDSPTGGALGQVSDMENKALQAARASLEQRQSPAQLRKNLEKIEDSYERWLKVITGEWTEADAQAYLDSLKEQEQEKEKEQEKPVPNIEDIVLINKYYKVK